MKCVYVDDCEHKYTSARCLWSSCEERGKNEEGEKSLSFFQIGWCGVSLNRCLSDRVKPWFTLQSVILPEEEQIKTLKGHRAVNQRAAGCFSPRVMTLN